MARKMKDSGIEWIGEIPEDWEISKLKYCVKYVAERADRNVNYIGLENVESWTGRYVKSSIQEADGASLKYDKENVLFGKLRPYLGKCLVTDRAGACSTEFIVMSPQKVGSHYLQNIILTPNFIDEVNMSTYGAKMPRANWSFVGNMVIPIPDHKEEQAIIGMVENINKEFTTATDKLKQSIENYKSLKQSLIARAVTKGVWGKRDMKDSGIEWVKEIPCEWDSINPKALFKQRKDRAKEGEKQLTASQKYGVIYQDDYMELTGSSVVLVEKDFSILKHVEAGDFVISMRSFQGGLEYSENTGAISSAYVMLIPNKEMVYPPFYKWLFKSSLYINALQSTSDLVRDGQAMRYSNFAKVRLYSVPINEQREIAAYLDEKCSAIDTLIAKKEQLLSELETYKKSLIYEYVTGKREVPA